MPELSQIVRQRLASLEAGAAQRGNHPDADTLTAYTEQMLSSSERERVQQHLAACRDCRDVVALSRPESLETLPVAAPAARRRTWRWRPALGLAASLAVLAVVTTIIIEMPKPASFESGKQTPVPPVPPAETTREQDSAKTAQPQPAAPSAPSAGSHVALARTPSAENANGVVGGTSVSPRRATSAAPAGQPPVAAAKAVSATSASSSPAVADARLHERDYVNKGMFVAGQAGNDAAPSAAEVPAAPMPQLAQGKFPPPLVSTTTLDFAGLPPQTQDNVTRRRQLSNPPNNRWGFGVIPNLSGLRKAEAKAEALAKRTVAIPPGALGFNNTMDSKTFNPSREDEVHATDANLKDQAAAGDLEQSSAFSQRALAGSAVRSLNLWSVSDGKLLKLGDSGAWAPGYTGEAIEFTVVVARGSNVWAGGANAALVHSIDGGATWQRVTLGASATGSITTIDAGGANVHVKTSSGQQWSSQDGGKSWSLDQ